MNRIRKSFSYLMHLEGTPEQIFPLLCPVREYDWIENWKCQIEYSDSGFAEKDCIFKTNFPNDGEDVWVTSGYEPPGLIEFIRVNKSRVIRYTITLLEKSKGKTESEWKQVVTALNPEGDVLVKNISETEFENEKRILECLLNHYLSTGTMLTDPDSI